MDQSTLVSGFFPASESPSLVNWQASGKWFNYGGHAVFSQMGGAGEALVLLHGFPTASWDWHRLWPFLVPHHRVFALDMMGFGFSDKPPDYPYAITDQADLHQGWLEQMGIERVHILAHDYGCSVAQELLARSQEGALGFSIASVCFLNGAIFPEVHQPLLIQKMLAGPVGGLLSRALSRRVFDYNLGKVFGRDTQPGREALDDFWQLLLYNNGRGVIHKLIEYMEERRCHRNRWVNALQQASQPMRLILGLADPISGRRVADRCEALLPNPDIVTLPGVGHYPHFERPAVVWQHYRDFQRGIQRDIHG